MERKKESRARRLCSQMALLSLNRSSSSSWYGPSSSSWSGPSSSSSSSGPSSLSRPSLSSRSSSYSSHPSSPLSLPLFLFFIPPLLCLSLASALSSSGPPSSSSSSGPSSPFSQPSSSHPSSSSHCSSSSSLLLVCTLFLCLVLALLLLLFLSSFFLVRYWVFAGIGLDLPAFVIVRGFHLHLGIVIMHVVQGYRHHAGFHLHSGIVIVRVFHHRSGLSSSCRLSLLSGSFAIIQGYRGHSVLSLLPVFHSWVGFARVGHRLRDSLLVEYKEKDGRKQATTIVMAHFRDSLCCPPTSWAPFVFHHPPFLRQVTISCPHPFEKGRAAAAASSLLRETMHCC